MCNYMHTGTTLECRGDGYLWDADYDGYDPAEKDNPCPECNTLEYLRAAKDEAESCVDGSVNGRRYTGESLWLGAVRVAEEANPVAAAAALIQIGIVNALVPDDTGEDGCRAQRYVYQ